MKATFAFCAVVTLALASWTLVGCQEKPGEVVKPKPQEAQPTLPKATITVADVSLEVEVADEEKEREAGYMFREEPKQSGMLFAWPTDDYRSFHMKNVSFDLDLAYIGADGTIFQTLRMKAFRTLGPGERSLYASLRPAKYALEVPAGWLAEHKITEGTAVKIPPDVQGKE
jgi:hypothetical protein